MSDPKVEIIVGDALTELRKFPSQSINCCVTSPPYWQLRDYGIKGQIGLEKTLEEYIQKLTAVFDEVRRALRNDGTLWLNLGDTYVTDSPKVLRNDFTFDGAEARKQNGGAGYVLGSLKRKDLAGIPWRIALALQEQGWYLRSDIIWHKPSPVPESVKDRPTRAHEYLFLFAKSPRYYYDIDAIREPHKDASLRKKLMPWRGQRWRGTPKNDANNFKPSQICHPLGKNRRSVWTIAGRGYQGKHFSTFPEKLVEPCIMAGCPSGGVVLDPFAGAGTTLLVASRLSRRSIGIEIKPAYVRLAKDRLESTTGSVALK